MSKRILCLTWLFAATLCVAQAPAGAPAGSTAVCNDGTYFSGQTKSGACRGHKGIKTWYGPASGAAGSAKSATTKATTKASSSMKAATPAAPAATPAPMPQTSAPASAAKAAKTPASARAAAAGGGPGMVWLNTSSNVYHCYGTKYYGTTKAGTYLSEADAKAKGAHADGGKPCGK